MVTQAKKTKDNTKMDRDYWIGYPDWFVPFKDRRLLSIKDACVYLSCSHDFLEELIAVGDIHPVQLGRIPKGDRDRRKRWIDRYDLDVLIEERKN